MLQWLYDHVKGKAKLAYEFKPDILHIMLGTNDIKNKNWDMGRDSFKDNYKKIVDGFKVVNPNLKVYVDIPLRIHKGNVFGTRSPKILEEEGIPRIYEIAAQIGAQTINYFDPTKDNPECFAQSFANVILSVSEESIYKTKP